jgi:hypothetical protein
VIRSCSSLWIAATVFLAPALCRAAETIVAVADFGYEDTSGEVKDQDAAHAARLHALQATIERALTETGRFKAEKLMCNQPVCSADSLDQREMVAAGKRQDARYIVFGGVHKMSTLIQWGRVEVMDTATGQPVLARTISFRGDDQDAWQHAGAYVAAMLAGSLK